MRLKNTRITNLRFPFLLLEVQYMHKIEVNDLKISPNCPETESGISGKKKAPSFNDFGCMHTAERTQQIFAINRSFSLQNFGNLVVRPFTFRKCTFLVFPGFLPSCVSPPAEVTEFKKSSSLGISHYKEPHEKRASDRERYCVHFGRPLFVKWSNHRQSTIENASS